VGPGGKSNLEVHRDGKKHRGQTNEGHRPAITFKNEFSSRKAGGVSRGGTKKRKNLPKSSGVNKKAFLVKVQGDGVWNGAWKSKKAGIPAPLTGEKRGGGRKLY